ncbi:MAG: hypothetical protein ACPLRU_04435, partial [Desulfofundulus sp.]
MRIGEELLVEQLEAMRDRGLELEYVPDCYEDACKKLADELNVPGNLYPAFRAYYLDYLSGGGATHLNGIFFNDEDVKDGIYDKIDAFYRPIFSRVERETDTDMSLYIEPSYTDRSYLIAVATRHEGKDLAVPFVVYRGGFKTWWSFFESEKPESIYRELESIYNSARAAVAAGLNANKKPAVVCVYVRLAGNSRTDLGRGVVVNGHLVVTEDPYNVELRAEEVAAGIALALGTEAKKEEVIVQDPGNWDWTEVMA